MMTGVRFYRVLKILLALFMSGTTPVEQRGLISRSNQLSPQEIIAPFAIKPVSRFKTE